MTTITTIDPSKFTRPKTDERWRGRFGEWTFNIGNDEPEMRKLAARMLEIENERPGSFSLRALSIMNDVDIELWKLFEDLIKNKYSVVEQLLAEHGLIFHRPDRRNIEQFRFTRAGRELELLTVKFMPKGI